MDMTYSSTFTRYDSETTCHCGGAYNGSDHCPECYCEQYESGDCGHEAEAECDGHLAVDVGLLHSAIGEVVYCDGSCQT
jgi:hypothetical protein